MQKKQGKLDTYHHQLRSTLYVFLILALFLITVEAMSAETASILPKGISRFRVVGIQTGTVTEKLNSNGRIEPIANGLNKSLTAADLAKNNSDLQKLMDGVTTAHLGNQEAANNLVNANLYGDFQLQATQVIPCYEYGLTENFNLGIRIPVIRRKVQASFRAESVNNAAAIGRDVNGMSAELDAGLAQLASMQFGTAFFTNQVFTSKGYEAPHDFDDTALGDIEVGGKYRLYRSELWTSSIQSGLRLPTGKRASRTNIFDTGTGNGTLATGVYLFNDVYPISNWTVGTTFKGIYNLPDQYIVAVPKNADDALPSNLPQDGQVQTVSRTSGMEYNAELSSTFRLFKNSVTPWVAYQWVQHGLDKYSGPGDLYYQGLEDGTDYTRHALEFGAGYTTVPAFAAKKASIPYTIEALYNRTFAGRNTTMISYVRLDLIAYF